MFLKVYVQGNKVYKYSQTCVARPIRSETTLVLKTTFFCFDRFFLYVLHFIGR